MSDDIKAKVTIESELAGADAALDKLKEMQSLAGSTGEALSQTAGNAGELGKQFSTVAEETAGFSKALDELAAPASATAAMIPEVASSLEEMRPAVEGATTSIQELNKPLDQTAGLLESAAPPMAQLTEHASSLSTEISPVAAGLVQIQEALGQTIPVLPQYAESMKAVTTSATTMSPALDLTQTNIAALDEILSSSTPFADMKNHLADTGQSFSDFATTVDPQKLSSFFDRIDQMAVQSTPAIAAYGEAVQTVGQSFTNAGQAAETFQKSSDPFIAAIQSTPAIAAYGEAVQTVGQSFTEASQPSETFQKTIIPGQFVTAEEYLAGLNGTISETGTISTQATQPLENLGSTVSSSGMAAKQAQTPFDNLQGSIVSTGEITSKFTGEMTNSLDAMARSAKVTGGTMGGFLGDMADVLGMAGGGIMDGLQNIAMPLMAVQQIGMIIGTVATGMYNAAVIAEGPAAHGIGTFTGSIDALGNTMAVNTQQFSEGFGKGIIPVIDAMNYSMSQGTGSAQDYGEKVGGVATMFTNLALITAGIAFPGSGMFTQGAEGFANQVSTLTGGPILFDGGPAPTQAQQIASIQAGLVPQTLQMQAQATDPTYLAAQAQLSYASGQAVIARQSWQDSHYTGSTGPLDPFNNLMQAQMDAANGQSYGTADYLNQFDPNRAYFNSLGATGYDQVYGVVGGAATGGCFIAGTKVLCRDNKERAIETLQVGDQIIGNNGITQVETTVLACSTYPQKQTYELLFSDGITLVLTDSHPIATLQGWKSLSPMSTKAENPYLITTILKPGDHIHTVSGIVILISIKVRDIAQVYNIAVNGARTYYANKILVHNKSNALSPSTVDSSGSITKNVPLTVTWSLSGLLDSIQKQTSGWSLSGILDQISKQTSGWSLSGILDQISKQTSGWSLSGILDKMSIQNSGWGLMGQLAQMSIQNSGWGLMGELVKTTEQISSWALSGELSKQWDAAVNWAVTGTLDKTFQGDVKWAATGLEHTFNAVATWVASNLNPVFQVAASFLGFASGVIDNPQSQIAMVGESGPELMYVPQGASIFPNGVNPLATGIGGIGSGSPSASFGGGSGSSGPVTFQLYMDSMMVAQSVLPQLSPLMRVQLGVRR